MEREDRLTAPAIRTGGYFVSHPLPLLLTGMGCFAAPLFSLGIGSIKGEHRKLYLCSPPPDQLAIPQTNDLPQVSSGCWPLQLLCAILKGP